MRCAARIDEGELACGEVRFTYSYLSNLCDPSGLLMKVSELLRGEIASNILDRQEYQTLSLESKQDTSTSQGNSQQ